MCGYSPQESLHMLHDSEYDDGDEYDQEYDDGDEYDQEYDDGDDDLAG